MSFDIDDDEYVAKLLAQDAKKMTKTYDLVGLDAFDPKRPRAGAPKPNTNFLRHIIRQTDNHNAALLAKEAEESSWRLRQMNRSIDKERTEAVDRAKRRIEGRLSPRPDHTDSRERSSQRIVNANDKDAGRSDRSRRHHDDRSGSRSRRHRDRNRDRHRLKRHREVDEKDQTSHQSKRSRNHREDEHRRGYSGDEDEKRPRDRDQRRCKSYSKSPSRSRSRSPHCKPYRTRDRTRSPRRSPRRSLRSPRNSRKSKRRSQSSASDSDPLEAIVGPLPPLPEPTVRSRGRGALKSNSLGIVSRFSTNYDPSMDMKPGSDAEDDWGEALEVIRDRERWKQQGADRLRATGFKDEQVKKWERGGDPLEEDVVWAKKGQGREWDRGKILDEDGDVDLKAEWGRL
ncbi:uncharacterized protein M421DRAFT_415116, partial [Didymella exigua CBS 183.55]